MPLNDLRGSHWLKLIALDTRAKRQACSGSNIFLCTTRELNYLTVRAVHRCGSTCGLRLYLTHGSKTFVGIRLSVPILRRAPTRLSSANKSHGRSGPAIQMSPKAAVSKTFYRESSQSSRIRSLAATMRSATAARGGTNWHSLAPIYLRRRGAWLKLKRSVPASA